MDLKALSLVAVLALSSLLQPAALAEDNRPIYVSLLPHFVVNLGPSNFMRVKAQVLVRDADTEAALKLHMPAVRHNLLMMFSDLRPSDLDSAEDKEKFNQDALTVVRTTLTNMSAPSNVGGFFVTDMVIQ